MKNKLVRILLLVLTIFFSSCNLVPEKENTTLKNNEYFDIEEFIDHQIDLLDSLDIKLSKTVMLNNKKETRTLKQIDWKKELALFRKLNVNKLSLRDSYEEDIISEPVNKTLVKNYTPLYPELKIKFLKIVFSDNNEVNSIEGRLFDKNALYKTEKYTKLSCKRQGDDQVIIDNYEISGYQKIILMDTFYYEIRSEIILLSPLLISH
ncbi:MAG: hypothetical protein FVQ77_14995 [Cytophagales bacterium]|nr:hypothetical protein [Cytophagales bacterium]